MPKITHYKVDKETIGDMAGAELVTAEDFERFVGGLEITTSWAEKGDFYAWRPAFPCARYGHFGTISEEALYRSNHAMVTRALDEIGSEYAEDHAGEILLPVGDTHALAVACKFEEDLKGYPVADEDDMSGLQLELEEEAYESYGRDDLIRELEDYPELEWIFEEEESEVRAELLEIVEPMLRRIAGNVVAYSGEMHFDDRSIRYALEEMVGTFIEDPRPTPDELAERFAGQIRYDRAVAEEAILQTVQPVIEDMAVPKRTGEEA